MGDGDDGEPAQGAEPALGRHVEEVVEHEHAEPAAAVQPQRAGEEHPHRVGRQLVQVGGPLPEEGVGHGRVDPVHHVGGEQQHQQPEVGSRRAPDVVQDGCAGSTALVQGRGCTHEGDSVVDGVLCPESESRATVALE